MVGTVGTVGIAGMAEMVGTVGGVMANASLLAAGVSFVVCLVLGPGMIRTLARMKMSQTVRSDGPASHAVKTGTPTMGGVIILVAVLIATVMSVRDYSSVAWVGFAMGTFGLVGLVDDLIIALTRRPLGLRARHKLAMQVALSLVVATYAYARPDLGGGDVMLPLGLGVWRAGALYIPFAALVLFGTANAVNLTDGLDGLAAGTCAVAAAAYAVISARRGDAALCAFSAGVVGACLGFSWFNAHPAQVFMGDTGALALGAGLGALAVFTGTELALPIIGGVFVIETLSVVAQVVYFRLTGGRRILKMSPLHHHFELSGLREPKVVTRFWIAACVFAALGLAAAGAL